MKGHGEAHGSHQPDVAPGGHAHQRLVLRQAGVEGAGTWGRIGGRQSGWGTLMQTENVKGREKVYVWRRLHSNVFAKCFIVSLL